MGFGKRTHVLFLVKGLVSAGLIFLVLRAVPLTDVGQEMGGADFGILLIAFFLMGLTPLTTGLRWHLVSRTSGPGLRLWPSCEVTYIGMLFGQVLPSAVGTDAVRGWYAYRRGMKSVEVGAAMILDRIYGVFSLVLLILVSMPRLIGVAPTGLTATVGLVSAALVAAAAVLILSRPLLHRMASLPQPFAFIAELVTIMRGAVLSKALPLILFVSFGMHLIVLGSAWFIARSIGVEIPFLDCVALVAPVLLVAYLPISFNGWGVREGAMVVGLGLIGVPSAQAVTVSLLLGIAGAIAVLPAAPMWLLQRLPPRRARSDAPDRPGDPGGSA
jgi:uncharacterized protein (TIRG00374 family)